ncbi:hypothetical protein GCM10010116_17770 [Microbispora rosea subsp. aerata]|nr:hypothetical protein [Microbispora rosea]GGO08735.1 hypothetical protein GCM10010116_17770 [Microbispora rosea subsp. aerata]GIH55340.1 hypothetical protein Mro02_22540 [Microbispora rosea subsp. aerata]GLJ84537.1 hypothetical protein GCM10017588_32650 [Microbispora rosea subsp. aerata]
MDASSYGPGLLGFIVIAAIGLALFFLLKNMNKQMRKIQVPPDGREDERHGNGPEA